MNNIIKQKIKIKKYLYYFHVMKAIYKKMILKIKNLTL